MWHWMAFQSVVLTASWLAWPVVVANAPANWLRIWGPLMLPVVVPASRPGRPPKVE
jgi:hypothetical protein